jgi:RimJ/RimL family protein N-acetyltransferase
MNPSWTLQTGRLSMRPVAWGDLTELKALKADPRVFAVMLGGVRTPEQTVRELAEDGAFWAAYRVGMWTVRVAATGEFVGMAGLVQRPDGRGFGLRFALKPEAQGYGYASEAVGAALRFAPDRAGLHRVIAVAREDNLASRTVLGAIGMVESETFDRNGQPMMVYASVRGAA